MWTSTYTILSSSRKSKFHHLTHVQKSAFSKYPDTVKLDHTQMAAYKAIALKLSGWKKWYISSLTLLLLFTFVSRPLSIIHCQSQCKQTSPHGRKGPDHRFQLSIIHCQPQCKQTSLHGRKGPDTHTTLAVHICFSTLVNNSLSTTLQTNKPISLASHYSCCSHLFLNPCQ